MSVFDRWLLPILFAYVCIARVRDYFRSAEQLGLCEDSELPKWQRDLVRGRQGELRRLVPDDVQNQFRKRKLGLAPAGLYDWLLPLLLIFPVLLNIYSKETLDALKKIVGLKLIDLYMIVICIVLFFKDRSYRRARQMNDSHQWILLIEPVGVSDARKLVTGTLALLLCLAFGFALFVARDRWIAGLMIVFVIVGANRINHQYEVGTELSKLGYFAPFKFIPWTDILNYRWFEERRGLLLVTDHPRADSPLLILPVPEGKADEVQMILDEVMTGKREEDVKAALAQL